MSNKLDCNSQYEFKRLLSPVVSTDNTELVSQTIDLQAYDGFEVAINSGTLSDASGTTITPKLFESDDSGMSGEAEVTDANLLYGAPTVWTEASDDAVQQFGYRGNKRYVRLKLTVAGNSGNIPISAVAMLRKKKVGSI